MLLAVAVLTVRSLAAEAAEYPLEQQLRPMVLPKGVGRIALVTAFDTVAAPRIEGGEQLWMLPQGAVGLGRVELGLETAVFVLPIPDWRPTIAATLRVSALDATHTDLAPGASVEVSVFLPSPVPYLYAVVDLGFRWVGDGGLSIRVGEDDTSRLLGFGHPTYGLDIPLGATLAWQASGRVALSAGASLGTLQVQSLRLYQPAWEEPNGAFGVQVAPAADLDVDGVVGLRGGIADPAFVVVELGLAVSSRW